MTPLKVAVMTALLGFRLALAQDPVSVRPAMVKVDFENEQIRVLHLRYAPHEKLPMHSHPGRVVVLLTELHLRSMLPDGTSRETRRPAGDIFWADRVTHDTENLSDAPFESIEIEVKKANSQTAIPITDAGRAATSNLTEPVPVEKEPHHHVLFQNQYVRVLDVLFPAGEASLFHTHSNDNLSVRLSGDKVQEQKMGGEWGEARDVVRGSVGFRKAAGQPYAHRVRSAGKLPFHVVDVEIVQ